MELKDQVSTWEQGERLLQLGMTSYGLFVHYKNRELPSDKGVKPKEQTASWAAIGEIKNGGVISYFPAFTVSELGEMLPSESGIICWEVAYNDHLGVWNCVIRDLVKWEGGDSIPPIAYESEGETMADCMADALIYCLENKLVTP